MRDTARMRAWARVRSAGLLSSIRSTCRSTRTEPADATSLGLLAVLHAFSTLNFWWLLAGLAAGYAFAWVGHFFFEKNRPATFTHPLYSFLGDWVMWKDMITGRIRF